MSGIRRWNPTCRCVWNCRAKARSVCATCSSLTRVRCCPYTARRSPEWAGPTDYGLEGTGVLAAAAGRRAGPRGFHTGDHLRSGTGLVPRRSRESGQATGARMVTWLPCLLFSFWLATHPWPLGPAACLFPIWLPRAISCTRWPTDGLLWIRIPGLNAEVIRNVSTRSKRHLAAFAYKRETVCICVPVNTCFLNAASRNALVVAAVGCVTRLGRHLDQRTEAKASCSVAQRRS